jgi:hypothetical protein
MLITSVVFWRFVDDFPPALLTPRLALQTSNLDELQLAMHFRRPLCGTFMKQRTQKLWQTWPRHRFAFHM